MVFRHIVGRGDWVVGTQEKEETAQKWLGTPDLLVIDCTSSLHISKTCSVLRSSRLVICATQVMKGRQEQIQGKMEEVRRQQEESLDRREQLLQELEVVDQLTRREQHETEARKAAQKQQLEAQVS